MLRLNLIENVRFALVAMRANKLRSFLTLVGVMAGVATVIMMISFVVGFDNSVNAAFTSFGAHLVQFQKYEPRFGPSGIPEEQRNRRDLTLEDAAALKRLARHAAAGCRRSVGITAGVEMKAGRSEVNGPTVAGVTPDYALANSRYVQDGRFLTDADVHHAARVCVIGVDVAEALFANRDPIGETLDISGQAYLVVGLFEKQGAFLGNSLDNFVTHFRSAPSTSSSRRCATVARTLFISPPCRGAPRRCRR